MSEFITIGEAMVLFGSCEPDLALKDASEYRKFLAGAEVNVCVGVARQGHSATYVTALGDDPFGHFIEETIQKNGIETDYISFTKDFWTGFMMKNRVINGDPDIFYWRKNSAAANFAKAKIDEIDLSDTKFAHLSGIFPAISDNALNVFRYLVTKLQEAGVRTTFDPNLRPQLWESQDYMIEVTNELAAQSEIILPGVNEGDILVGTREPSEIADFYLNQSDITQTVIVKLGEEGAYVKQKDGREFTVAGFKAKEVVDTVGAGDGFAAGLISSLLEGETIEQAVRRASAIGCLAVQSPGDNDGYPTVEELQAFYAEQA
ncbi:2-dehydro-3-deoxygluconokinase [Bacilli bacterium]|nr:2-dehydro-3-deoxygluconokinase [Bacilli bacterium]